MSDIKEKLLMLIPEFNLIKDEELKNSCIETWILSMKEGGWEIEDLTGIPFTLLIENVGINLIEHTRAVTLTALRMGETLKEIYGDKIKIDFDLLVAGGILHDVGKLLEYEKKDGKYIKSRRGNLLRHPVSGVIMAGRCGVPDKVLHLIAVHSKEGEGMRRSVEAILINHADFSNFEPFKL
jgi:putative nucleotidyltransferase with HDIG domain